MCQQTQIRTVLPYYARWMAAFPTVETLAAASEEQVMAHWQGLGYYARGLRLHRAARVLVQRGWPTTLEGWRAVPGVGPYTAGALASIVNGLPEALVDGNVERVVARVAGLDVAGTALNQAAWEWARANLVQEDPGTWNQALMELGALVCTPRAPDCPGCPVREHCVSYREGAVDRRPVPKPKVVAETVWLDVRVCRREDGAWGLVRAPAGEWWHGLWVFPWARVTERPTGEVRQVTTVVTRHRVTLVGRLDVAPMEREMRWVSGQDWTELPVPRPFRRLAEAWATSGSLDL